MQVEIWSDVVCPWCYLGKRQFEQAVATLPFRDEIDVRFRSFELDPTAPRDEVEPMVNVLAEKYGLTLDRAEPMQQQMEQRAATVGLTFRMTDLERGNTRDAHRVIHLAEQHGRQAQAVEALHRAYFTEQRSVFSHESLSAIAAETGLDAGEVADLLGGERFEAEVSEDEHLARSFGITGVPYFVFDRRFAVSGAQPPEVLAQVLQRAQDEAGV